MGTELTLLVASVSGTIGASLAVALTSWQVKAWKARYEAVSREADGYAQQLADERAKNRALVANSGAYPVAEHHETPALPAPVPMPEVTHDPRP